MRTEVICKICNIICKNRSLSTPVGLSFLNVVDCN